MTIEDFNHEDHKAAAQKLLACCGSANWTKAMMESFPFVSAQQMVKLATDHWYGANEADWLEAFRQHPRIGDLRSLEKKFASTKHLAGTEQASVANATSGVLMQLAEANQQYEEKYGFIFIVCATGKSAEEMLRLLQDRLQNSYHEELNVAANEQHKITLLRLKKTFSATDWQWMRVSQLTTHVLDTALGKPGAGITIRLQEQQHGSSWQTVAQGVSNADGRLADLLPPERSLVPGAYLLCFDTGAYYVQQKIAGFYPEVRIQFNIFDDQHYHVPLLISPFGYSTYRGS